MLIIYFPDSEIHQQKKEEKIPQGSFKTASTPMISRHENNCSLQWGRTSQAVCMCCTETRLGHPLIQHSWDPGVNQASNHCVPKVGLNTLCPHLPMSWGWMPLQNGPFLLLVKNTDHIDGKSGVCFNSWIYLCIQDTWLKCCQHTCVVGKFQTEARHAQRSFRLKAFAPGHYLNDSR